MTLLLQSREVSVGDTVGETVGEAVGLTAKTEDETLSLLFKSGANKLHGNCKFHVLDIVGEWVGASEGLGYLMLHANGRMQTDLMFAALFVLALLAVSLYYLINAILNIVLKSLQHRQKFIFWLMG